MDNITLRPLTIEDASTSYKWRNDPIIWQYTERTPESRVTEEAERVENIKKLNDKSSSRFAILFNNIYVGNAELTDIKNNQTADYHIFIGEKDIWGKGIAQNATLQIIDYATNVLELKEITLWVHINNKVALAVYENVGFVEEYSQEKYENYIFMKLDLIKTQNTISFKH